MAGGEEEGRREAANPCMSCAARYNKEPLWCGRRCQCRCAVASLCSVPNPYTAHLLLPRNSPSLTPSLPPADFPSPCHPPLAEISSDALLDNPLSFPYPPLPSCTSPFPRPVLPHFLSPCHPPLAETSSYALVNNTVTTLTSHYCVLASFFPSTSLPPLLPCHPPLAEISSDALVNNARTPPTSHYCLLASFFPTPSITLSPTNLLLVHEQKSHALSPPTALPHCQPSFNSPLAEISSWPSCT